MGETCAYQNKYFTVDLHSQNLVLAGINVFTYLFVNLNSFQSLFLHHLSSGFIDIHPSVPC